ncbi:hypothetical protein RFI_08060 [Reticulomyxa filosa]|uniref:Uncharacterized protein n=1 Tax=Reticulomyxa filosa TaxID=46433 RepID=X6NSY0_RETFI|nr:hypothetical protein RFI_08060 [Reticulomyxa filosa]|eukprot:ETO29063.1 hypothetical protein RFI_08060 [Reticulomyxa filosa]
MVLIFIKGANGEHLSLDVSANSTVKDLKKRISKQLSVASKRQRLIFRGNVLKDEETLRKDKYSWEKNNWLCVSENTVSYSIQKECTIQLFVPKKNDDQNESRDKRDSESRSISNTPIHVKCENVTDNDYKDRVSNELNFGDVVLIELIEGKDLKKSDFWTGSSDPYKFKSNVERGKKINKTVHIYFFLFFSLKDTWQRIKWFKNCEKENDKNDGFKANRLAPIEIESQCAPGGRFSPVSFTRLRRRNRQKNVPWKSGKRENKRISKRIQRNLLVKQSPNQQCRRMNDNTSSDNSNGGHTLKKSKSQDRLTEVVEDGLEFLVYDHDTFTSDDFLGKAQVRLDYLPFNTVVDLWIPLENVETGHIHVKIRRCALVSPMHRNVVFKLMDKERSITAQDLHKYKITLNQLVGEVIFSFSFKKKRFI